jgi:hypothetical protein
MEEATMSTKLTCHDEKLGGERTSSVDIYLESAKTTIREIIKARIYQEVQDYNQKLGEVFMGLVKPSEAEQMINGYKMKRKQPIDWLKQSDLAQAAFLSNGFFILVDDKQAEEIDQVVEVGPNTTVSFVKLVQLVGG